MGSGGGCGVSAAGSSGGEGFRQPEGAGTISGMQAGVAWQGIGHGCCSGGALQQQGTQLLTGCGIGLLLLKQVLRDFVRAVAVSAVGAAVPPAAAMLRAA